MLRGLYLRIPLNLSGLKGEDELSLVPVYLEVIHNLLYGFFVLHGFPVSQHANPSLQTVYQTLLQSEQSLCRSIDP
jgi:hypothetical protein